MKNGRSKTGKMRWRCLGCNASLSVKRVDKTALMEFGLFLQWVWGKQDARSLAAARGWSLATFRRRLAWCWQVEVLPPKPTGQVHDYLQIDGTYFNSWCLLIAFDGTQVVSWQWCERENAPAYRQLLSNLPQPDMVILDGANAAARAVKDLWPQAKTQRCLFHLQATITKHLTRQPRLEAGREIKALSQGLSRVESQDQARAWMQQYQAWQTKWHDFLAQRTYARDKTTNRPAWAKANQTWWYTHPRLRRVRGLFRHLIKTSQLFTYLEFCPPRPRTTSPLEGGINKAIKDLQRQHRGHSPQHAQRAVEWFLTTQTVSPYRPSTSQILQAKTRASKPAIPAHKHLKTPLYDTAFSPEDGNHTRKGWAGRTT